MRKCLAFLFIAFLSSIFAAPFDVSATIVINEVLFDPAGTDTGLEKIEIYNPDGTSQDMGGWELYPDGIGYFSFPAGFSLGAKSFVVIHLRASGANDTANLHHSAPSKNMGNTSGSVALFNSGSHTKTTLVDFVEWSSKGASSTWESYAADKGLWQKEMPVDTAALQEGGSIGLINDGIRQNAASWKIYASPSIGGANAATSSESSSSAATSTPPAASVPSSAGPLPTPSLGADAGPDAAVIAGAIVAFRGMAFGLDGEPLSSARFLWNFGDGRLQEGKSLNHVYYFPGTYQANLSVSSGEYTGSDWRIITVIAPALSISEVQPGNNGFVELFNASDKPIELSGINLEDDSRNIFRIPAGTVVGAGSVIVLANVISGLNPSKALILRDARSSVLDKAEFSQALPFGASLERAGETFIVANTPTPGKFNPESGRKDIIASATSIPHAPPAILNPAAGYSVKAGGAIVGEPAVASEAPSSQNPSGAINKRDKPATLASLIGANVFFGASIILGLAAAAGFILAKRRML